MIDELIKLSELLTKSLKTDSSSVSYNGKLLRFKFNSEDKENLKQILTQFGISYQLYPSDECEFTLTEKYKNNTIIFFDESDYLIRCYDLRDEIDTDNFLILLYNDGYLLKRAQDKFTDENALFFNGIQYQIILHYVAANSEFTSLHDNAKQQLIIFSGDKGPFYIGYNLLDKRVKSLPDLQIEYSRLQDFFSRFEFVQFFKEAVINSIHQQPIAERFFAIIQSLSVLLELSTRDHNIYLRKFGFDKIKAKFKEERVKYFDSIEKSIDGISKQVTAFPLTFAASIFAGYQVKGTPAILILILCAYFLYTTIAWKILNLIAFNNDNIDLDVKAESLKIQNEYDIIYAEFSSDFDKIGNKITKLKNLIAILRTVLVGLLLAFIVFTVYEIAFAPEVITKPTEVIIINK